VDLDRETKQQGMQEVVNKQEAPTGNSITLVNSIEHYGMTGAEWDPSGRYIAAVGSIWLGSVRQSVSRDPF
jgi:translation initiation factor 3 subunit B